MRRSVRVTNARDVLFRECGEWMRRGAWCTALALTVNAPRADAQGRSSSLTGYYQNVFVASAASAGVEAGVSDAQRARLMWKPALGAFSIDAAYEHTIMWRSASTGAGAGFGLLSPTAAANDFLHLQWTVHQGAHLDWRQQFDRLALTHTSRFVTASVGRQAISWATTLLLTPADPFLPFDPSDPFREYRTGVDAVRMQWFTGAFSVVDVVVRPAETPRGRTITALVRGKTSVRGWELSAWGGRIHDEPGGAVGVTRTVAGSAIRAESELRRDTTGKAVARLAVGVDRRFTVWSRDLYAVVEYQHDPFGAAHPADLLTVAQSPVAAQREMQLFGRDESALQVSYQLHPLVAVEALALWNARDGSALASGAAAVSVSDNISARLGVFVPAGPAAVALSAPRSEYGSAPVTGYAALSLFF